MRPIRLFVLCLSFFAAACDQSPAAPGHFDLGLDGMFSCGVAGEACTNGTGCCAGACDTVSHTCAVTGGACATAGATCTKGPDCCSNVCTGGKCGAAACKPIGTACTTGSDCCTTVCTNSQCAAIPTPPGVTSSCVTLGNQCGGTTDGGAGGCCSGNCQGGLCASAGCAGGGLCCASVGDICFKASDCCTTLCQIVSGQSVGTCGTVTTTGAGSCLVDGQACTSAQDCCSKQCVATNTGGHVCQTAVGCRVVGDICTKDADCCNSTATMGSACGAITCVLDNTVSPPVGRCRNPVGGNNPEGAICGGVNNTGGAARQDCCNCQPPKFDCCKPDANGVYRCYGTPTTGNCPTGYTGTAPCCIAAGGQCAFSSECCGGAPCVPDANGTLRCLMANPDGGVTCQPTGAVCTSNGDCCVGLACNIPAGATSGTCGVPPSPTGTDGGAPTCASTGQGCVQQSDCCSGLTCFAPGGTGVACAAGQAGCTCAIIVK